MINNKLLINLDRKMPRSKWFPKYNCCFLTCVFPLGGGSSSSSGRSSSFGRSSSPQRSAPVAPRPPVQHAPPMQAPPQGGGMMSGIGSTIMTGMAFGAGSEIAHQAVRGMMGGSGSHGGQQVQQQDQAQPEQQYAQPQQQVQ